MKTAEEMLKEEIEKYNSQVNDMDIKNYWESGKKSGQFKDF